MGVTCNVRWHPAESFISPNTGDVIKWGSLVQSIKGQENVCWPSMLFKCFKCVLILQFQQLAACNDFLEAVTANTNSGSKWIGAHCDKSWLVTSNCNISKGTEESVFALSSHLDSLSQGEWCYLLSSHQILATTAMFPCGAFFFFFLKSIHKGI